MQLDGLKLSGALEDFSITLQFKGSKMKKALNFEENKGFECSFLHIEVQVISNPSSRLEKHKTSKYLLINNFLRFKKKCSFSTFSDFFENIQLPILKSSYAFLCKHVRPSTI